MSDNNCIRILRIVAVMNRGGIETQIMNMYRKLDRKKFQFDFLVTRDEIGVFDEEIKELGGRIYRIPSIRDVGLISFVRNIDKFFNDHREYNIVHSHMNTWSGLFLGIAKKHGVKVRIAQSHSAQQGHKQNSLKEKFENIFKKIMRFFIKYNATHFWAVGQAAGEWLYGKKIASTKMRIVPNAKDLELYKFDINARELLRGELGVPNDAFVIGHVGSFSTVKNHSFLIDIFTEVLKKDKNVFLCLVGDGPLRSDIEAKIKEQDIVDYTLVLGLRNDVDRLMSMFDVLVLPSLFEGMPNVVIEAQAATLPCVVSDTITKEVDMGMGILSYISLSAKQSKWVDSILSYRENLRNLDLDNIYDKGYDLNSLIKWLESFYTTNANENSYIGG